MSTNQYQLLWTTWSITGGRICAGTEIRGYMLRVFGPYAPGTVVTKELTIKDRYYWVVGILNRMTNHLDQDLLGQMTSGFCSSLHGAKKEAIAAALKLDKRVTYAQAREALISEKQIMREEAALAAIAKL